MPTFDKSKYLAEIAALVLGATEQFAREHFGVEVYTVSLWTDPNAAASAFSFDTAEHSTAAVGQGAVWARAHFERLLAEGDHEQAKLFLPSHPGARNVNPADFAFRNFGLVEHESFPKFWEEDSGGACWDELEPALIEAAQAARPVLERIRLHADAVFGVNSREDWFAVYWPLKAV